MIRNILKISLFIVVAGALGCVEEFSPPEINNVERYLVVDGFLNASNDTSWVNLSRTLNTNDPSFVPRELGATLSIENEGGISYSFKEKGGGAYYLPPIPVVASNKYRLKIVTSNGSQYYSEYVPVTLTPPIDSVTYLYNQDSENMIIKVNSHDNTGKTRFYRWKFEETYQYRAAYYSGYEYVGREIKFRSPDISLCWKTNLSSNIILGSTIKLNADIIKDLPVNYVPKSTNKLYIRYSILVKQYGLSQPEFEYWTSLSKTTQGTGTLFDPQPSQVTGNIKNPANSKELVFGYFSAATESKSRIFMSPRIGLYPTCSPPDTIAVKDFMKNPYGYILNYVGESQDSLTTTGASCADCRVFGGTITKPSFWIE